MKHHVVPRKHYYLVFLALLCLTGTTVAANFVDVGGLNLLIALCIAFTKASLVVLIFMNVRFSSPLTKLFVAAGLFWLFTLILLTFSDYVSRGWIPTPQPWQESPNRNVDNPALH
ncbi:MAG: cytochrome C oxidase subunit IV family protein [Acidobacteria bacterium]|nr:cytochrome C oxidase subunit IV family protein [Acidobacteriota bacterium]MBI3280067.1 cytochrome C oxidase subunit IV family protein [Acidobacteriota bacterium]